MNTNLVRKIILVSMTAGLFGAAHAVNISKDEYKSSKERIENEYKSEKSACSSVSGNAKDVCVEKAKAKEKVARAELEYNYTGKVGDKNKLRDVKADTEYNVAKEMCDDKTGNDKDVCVKEAKAAKVRARADNKMNEASREAKMDNAQDKRDADYKVAAEKCESLAGDAKSNCMTQARVRFGKN